MDNAFLCAPIPYTVAGYSDQTAAGPATNVTNDRLGRVWQAAPGSGAVVIYCEFPALTDIDTVAVLATNLEAASNYQLQYSSSPFSTFNAGLFHYENGVSLASADGINRVHRQMLVHTATPYSVRTLGIKIDSTQPYFTAGRIVIGKAFQPAENIDFGWDFGIVDRGSTETTELGITNAVIGSKVMQYRFAWAYETEAEARGAGLELGLYAGKTKPVLFCGDYAATDKHNLIGYGRLQEGARFNNFMFNGYASAFGIESDLIFTI